MWIFFGIIFIVIFVWSLCFCKVAKKSDNQNDILLRNEYTTLADCLFAYNEYGWTSVIDNGKFVGFIKE
mgnify:FL=1